MQTSRVSSDTGATRRIPPALWIVLAIACASILAVFVFKVAAGTVLTYAFIAFMGLGHMFMHGGHGHAGHAEGDQSRDRQGRASSGADTDARDRPGRAASETGDEDQHKRHAGGCH